MGLDRGEETFPEVDVVDRLPVPLHPAGTLPVVQPPFGHRVDQIAGIRIKGDFTRFIQQFHRGDRGEDFHAVVGGVAKAAGKLAAVGFIQQNGAVAAGTGIALTGAVGVDLDRFHDLAGFLFRGVRTLHGVNPAGLTWPGAIPRRSASSVTSAEPVARSIAPSAFAAAAASSCAS